MALPNPDARLVSPAFRLPAGLSAENARTIQELVAQIQSSAAQAQQRTGGELSDVTFGAALFGAQAPMAWTVTAPQVLTNCYRRSGAIVEYQFWIQASTIVTGGAATLFLATPYWRWKRYAAVAGLGVDNGTAIGCVAYTIPNTNYISIVRPDFGNWAASINTSVAATMIGEVVDI